MEVWNGIWKKILVWNGIWNGRFLVWNGNGMEENCQYGMEMEWKKIVSMDNGKIVFQSIPYHALVLKQYFLLNSPKIKSFLQKNAKSSSAGGSAPTPPCLRRLGALPPDPQPSAMGASPPDSHWPPAAGGSAHRPPKLAPQCEFLATRLS